jgi:methylmalonyl-CoA mutase N-terminal domain/subunit
MREAIADAAFRHHEQVLAGERKVVGVNVHLDEDEQPVEIHRVDPRIEADQVERLRALRAGREQDAVDARLEDVRAAARGGANLLPPMREALRARATVGEVCGALRAEFGEYDRVRPT